MASNTQPTPDASRRPLYYDAEGKPVYENSPNDAMQAQPTAENHEDVSRSQPVVDPNSGDRPEVPPAAKAAQANVLGPERTSPSSHISSAPQMLEGESFDPQIRSQYANEPGTIHATREIEPEKREISKELQKRHEESKKRYPRLNLSEGEVVILSIRRHPIGLFLPLIGGGSAILALIVALIVYPTDTANSALPSYGVFVLIVTLVMILIGIGSYLAVWVYQKNQFFMTNESVIQEIQHSIFSKREQTVSLGSIEDASFRKSGILQTMLDYGTIRLSTEGEETTYRFAYVENPREQVAILNNGVESFKNGRPVELQDDEN